MISPKEIKEKALRIYQRQLLAAYVAGDMETVLQKPIAGKQGDSKTDPRQLTEGIRTLRQHSKAATGRGYTLVEQTVNHARYGAQRRVERIFFETLSDWLHYIGQAEAFAAFQEAVALIRSQQTTLEDWLRRYPGKVVKHLEAWPRLLRVCHYVVQYPTSGLYLRELPIAEVHTKFIQQHLGILTELLDQLLPEAPPAERTEGEESANPEKRFCQRFGFRYEEPTVRIRPLDETLTSWGGFRDVAVPLSDLAAHTPAATRVVIVENLITYLTLPSLTDAYAIWGSGFSVNRLRALPWLAQCTLYYWGDIDVSGLAILSQVRRIFPEVIPVMMDQNTLKQFEAFSDVLDKPQKADQVLLDHLTTQEQALFEHLRTHRLQLEQEQIPMKYVRELWEGLG